MDTMTQNDKFLDNYCIFLGFLMGNLIFQLVVSQTVNIPKILAISFLSTVIYSILSYFVSYFRKK